MREMHTFRQFVARYQLAVFFLLTYLISWSLVIPAQGGELAQGPMIAAFIGLAVVAGQQGTADLWRQIKSWRVGWQWYLIAPGIVVAFHLCALATNLLLGATVTHTAHIRSLATYAGIVLDLLLLGGMWEEPGWTGYALPRFQQRFPRSPVIASLALGVFRMIWHTPLLIYGTIPWYDFIFYTFALQCLISWLYNRTHGSVLIVMLLHLCSNVAFRTLYPLFGGSDQERYWILETALACAITLGILVATRGRLGQEADATNDVAYADHLQPIGG